MLRKILDPASETLLSIEINCDLPDSSAKNEYIFWTSEYILPAISNNGIRTITTISMTDISAAKLLLSFFGKNTLCIHLCIGLNMTDKAAARTIGVINGRNIKTANTTTTIIKLIKKYNEIFVFMQLF
jgi:hypothetical protein